MNNKYWHLTPVEYINRLFSDTKDGVMTVTYYPNNGEQEYDMHYKVFWDSAEKEKIIRQYTAFTAVLDKLGKLHNELENEENRKKLSPEEQEIWETYINPLIPFEVDQAVIDELYFRGEYDSLEDEENELLERYYEWQEQQYLERLPKKCRSPRDLIENSQLYEKGVSENAHPIYMNYIGRWLAEAMVLYNYSLN